MKYIVIVGDGMADHPLEELGNKTPLQIADTPNMDEIAKRGASGLFKTIPNNMGAGSDIANLSIMGYDPKKYYTGRGPLEAASMGVEIGEKDLVFRCNIITEKNGRIKDYSAGHISSSEAEELLKAASNAFSDVGEFYSGISYRHIFVLRNSSNDIISTPPHDALDGKISRHLLKPKDSPIAAMLNEMMLNSREVLSKHPINLRRMEEGKKPGNMLWLWGQGTRPKMEPLEEKYGLRGAVVSAVDVIKGLGRCIGMDILKVEGATGYYDTNYEGKARTALHALRERDYVYVHVEAIDEASHAGDLEMKIKALEDFDSRLVGEILNGLQEFNDPTTIGLLPDHATPIEVRTHVRDAVPFVIMGGKKDDTRAFDEASAKKGFHGQVEGEEFMESLLTPIPESV
jgi:2,3-bisphosphoglycerate-independent phosphoglycerate mutase